MYDLPEQFCDLSERRQRMIAEYVSAKVDECRKTTRHETQMDTIFCTVSVGIKSANESFGFGKTRAGKLLQNWQRDLFDFYEDRDVREEQLRKWLENMGLELEREDHSKE